jgi:hypothetical protein
VVVHVEADPDLRLAAAAMDSAQALVVEDGIKALTSCERYHVQPRGVLPFQVVAVGRDRLAVVEIVAESAGNEDALVGHVRHVAGPFRKPPL